jgi:DNA-binding response OmpR family regulator
MDANPTPRTLMIIEDHAATRRALGTTFVRRGWKVRSAAAVAEALHLLGRGPEPDGLILDLILPDGDGLDVLRWVRDAGLRTHIAVYTGATDPMLLVRARALRPDLLLIKPVDADVLCNLCAGWARPA